MTSRCLFLWTLTVLSLHVAAQASALKVHVADQNGQAVDSAVVYLESAEARAATRPAHDVTIAQVHKEYQPRVTVVPVGTAVAFPNRDTVRHHVYSFSKFKTFELKLYAGTPAQPVVFDQPGVAVLGCNIHDFMVAWVVVVETPYYGRTGSNGEVMLSNVPEGNYRLRVWHESFPAEAQPVEQAVRVSGPNASTSITLNTPKS